MQENVVPIDMPIVTKRDNLSKTLYYGVHTFSLKDMAFARQDITYQLHTGHVAIFNLAEVKHLQVLWLLHMEEILQRWTNIHLIYDFLGESQINV